MLLHSVIHLVINLFLPHNNAHLKIFMLSRCEENISLSIVCIIYRSYNIPASQNWSLWRRCCN